MKIAITAPAGPVNPDKLRQGLSKLKALGYDDFVIGETCQGSYFWNSAPPLERAREFENFWQDPAIEMVWAARGGFGCAHLLDLIDWVELGKHQKILCGHSDLTILHLAFKKFAIKHSVSGLMPTVEFADAGLDHQSRQDFEASLKLNIPSITQELVPLKKGAAEGFLMPVTLSVLCSLLGTPFMPSLEGAVLVIEDINESPYRLDAYLTQLKNAGVLASLSGMIWGDFNDCGTAQDLQCLYEKFSPIVTGPVASGLAFGHCLPRISLPVGINVKFVVNEVVSIESVVL